MRLLVGLRIGKAPAAGGLVEALLAVNRLSIRGSWRHADAPTRSAAAGSIANEIITGL